ncbi:MAG TPA: SsrA-binding protein SmpB [Candidatus Marinimicrobia bacterium]|jgi:SsrA-binding protein|nr:SsrA-binding protein SmpB [Candidatus Neomarinimicrobiota bacterium]HHZ98461.1 SsrA-binding protein SmpB [Candidatus Neomarinimicrobiota bacterium]HIB71580.1 SsrA-binding protein SmpB [Candidatus Neomarinimicrobiota bacterium]HIB96049.1 SsrA-binding protein SmpB [Candidatus Neomarinimicrobiota bacterium]HIC73960.1 SsrA-binding protein SmpB [Candidatus Neomarinimicrobiota bacterium]
MPDEFTAVTKNRKAFHDYEIFEKFEAGMELLGSEVKSLREGKINLRDTYALIRDNEVFLVGMHIGQYSHTGYLGHEPYRDRRLLLHKQEIRKLIRKVNVKGMTIIPLRIYFKNGWAKAEIGLAKSKKTYQKKRVIAERDHARDLDRELKERKRS